MPYTIILMTSSEVKRITLPQIFNCFTISLVFVDSIWHKMRLYGKVTDRIGVDEMRCSILTLYGTFLENGN